MMDHLKMIEELCNAHGAPGFEDEVVALGRKYGEELAEISEDCLRNLYFNRKGNTGKKPVVMLDAHSDEVAFIVSGIKENGTIKFTPLGGWTPNNIPAHTMRILNADGQWIYGIVAAKPSHFVSAAERNQAPSIADMVIDVGACSKKEVEEDYKIRFAAPIVPDVTFAYDEKKGLMTAKAFDDRIGCAAVLAAMDALKGEELKVDVVGTWTAQEELSGRGMKVAVNRAKPDIAIILEGSPADDSFVSVSEQQCAMRKGPMLRHMDGGMLTNPRFQRFTLDLARKYGIPVQEGLRTAGTTNATYVYTTGEGIPAIVIGIPVRYSHSHYGFCAVEDYEAGVRLAAEIIKALDEETIAGF